MRIFSEVTIMAKKSVNEKKEKVLDFILSIAENQSKNIIDFVRRITRVRERMRKLVVATGLTLAGLIVVFIGLANYLSSIWPNLQDGIILMIVGLAAILIAVVYKQA